MDREEFLQEELKDTSQAALKNFRISLVILALLASTFGFLYRTNVDISSIFSSVAFSLGIGLILGSMFLSILVLVNRWLENEFIPDSLFTIVDTHYSEVESFDEVNQAKLKENRGLLVASHAFLLFAILLIGMSFITVVSSSTLPTYILIISPALLTAFIYFLGGFEKLGGMDP